MSKVPREIDELMWEVAELDDLDTIDQFGARYPEFRNELIKRLQMVRSLRGSRPKSATPEFVPRQNVRNFGPSKLAVAMVAIIVLASVSFATYATMKYVRAQEKPVSTSSTTVASSSKVPVPSIPTKRPSPTGVVRTQPELPPGSEQPLREFDTFQFLVTIESEDMSLVDVINEIARVSGAEIVIAPGFEDVSISLSFVEQPAIGVLQELGVRFGFTALRQGATEMLIIPARDESESPTVPVVGAAEKITAETQSELDDSDDSTTSDSDDPKSMDETKDHSNSDK